MDEHQDVIGDNGVKYSDYLISENFFNFAAVKVSVKMRDYLVDKIGSRYDSGIYVKMPGDARLEEGIINARFIVSITSRK